MTDGPQLSQIVYCHTPELSNYHEFEEFSSLALRTRWPGRHAWTASVGQGLANLLGQPKARRIVVWLHTALLAHTRCKYLLHSLDVPSMQVRALVEHAQTFKP